MIVQNNSATRTYNVGGVAITPLSSKTVPDQFYDDIAAISDLVVTSGAVSGAAHKDKYPVVAEVDNITGGIEIFAGGGGQKLRFSRSVNLLPEPIIQSFLFTTSATPAIGDRPVLYEADGTTLLNGTGMPLGRPNLVVLRPVGKYAGWLADGTLKDRTPYFARALKHDENGTAIDDRGFTLGAAASNFNTASTLTYGFYVIDNGSGFLRVGSYMGRNIPITGIADNTTYSTVTVSAVGGLSNMSAMPFTDGATLTISNCATAGYDGTYPVSNVTATTFTIPVGGLGAAATGTVQFGDGSLTIEVDQLVGDIGAVFVKRDNSYSGWMRTKDNATIQSQKFAIGGTTYNDHMITAISGKSFTIGNGQDVNAANGEGYDFIVFADDPRYFATANFVGNGAARTLNALPWTPEVVIVKSHSTATQGNAELKTASMPATESCDLDTGAQQTTRLTGIVDNGVTVGSTAIVNLTGATITLLALKKNVAPVSNIDRPIMPTSPKYWLKLTDGAATVGATDALDLSGAFSVSTLFKWTKPAADVLFNYILSRSLDASHFQFRVGIDTNTNENCLLVGVRNGTDQWNTGLKIKNNTVYHLVVSFDPATYTWAVSLNGKIRKHRSIQYAPSPVSGYQFVIGGAWNSGAIYMPFTGSVGDLRIYKRALTPDEHRAEFERSYLNYDDAVVDYSEWWPCDDGDGSVLSAHNRNDGAITNGTWVRR